MIRPIIAFGLFLVMLVASFVIPAHAAVGDLVKPTYRKNFVQGSYTSPYYFTPSDYCNAYYNYIFGPSGGISCTNARVTGTSSDQLNEFWAWTVKRTDGGADSSGSVSGGAYCDPATMQGPGPYNTSDQTKYWCKVAVDPCADKNTYQRRFYYKVGPYVAPDHFGQCAITASQMLDCRKEASSGSTYCYWQFNRTGLPYTATDNTNNGSGGVATPATVSYSDPQTKSPAFTNPTCSNCPPCPMGTVQAGTDSAGIPVCMGTGTAPPDPPKAPTTTTQPTTTTTNADGSTKAVTVKTQANADGSTTTTTTTTTTSASGAVTTSQDVSTSATPGGAPGRFDNPSADQSNLCKQNPNLSICRESSVSGSCAAIACTGDAIQCATLRAAELSRCAAQKDRDDLAASPLSTLGEAAASGNDPLKASLPSVANASVVNVPTSLDQSGWLGSGKAFDDVTFEVQGHSVTVPLEKWSGYLVGLRYALMVAALLVSMRILSGAVMGA